jgi:hypothetical protein
MGMGLVRLNLRHPSAVSHPMTGPIENARARLLVVVSTGALAAVLFVACGSSGPTTSSTTTPAPAPTTSTTAPPRDVTPTAADFVNVNRMTRVGDHFIASLNGHLAEALAVARHPKDAVYPVGTVLQLIPTEAMVKRHKGYSPATGDWEFFSLQVSPTGTEIRSSGAKVRNFLGGECASCHLAAKSHFDFVCGNNHGCAPLPIGADVIAALQKSDPRPQG